MIVWRLGLLQDWVGLWLAQLQVQKQMRKRRATLLPWAALEPGNMLGDQKHPMVGLGSIDLYELWLCSPTHWLQAAPVPCQYSLCEALLRVTRVWQQVLMSVSDTGANSPVIYPEDLS